MICALYTLKKKYMDKNVYIWNVNRDSMGVFMRASIRRIDIKGFVSVEGQYIGDVYMNRPVVSLAQVEQEDNSIILVGDDAPRNAIKTLLINKIIYWTEAQEINSDLCQGKNIVYGTGNGAEELCSILDQEQIDVELYCVSKRDHIARNKGKEVIEANELDKYTGYNIILSVKKFTV